MCARPKRRRRALPFAFATSSDQERQLPRGAGRGPASSVTLSWKSFTAAADQAGISREYGGIHFKYGDFEARQAGELVGLQVWSKAKTYFNGKAIPRHSRGRPASLRRCAARLPPGSEPRTLQAVNDVGMWSPELGKHRAGHGAVAGLG
jgi:hypothetical protein